MRENGYTTINIHIKVHINHLTYNTHACKVYKAYIKFSHMHVVVLTTWYYSKLSCDIIWRQDEEWTKLTICMHGRSLVGLELTLCTSQGAGEPVSQGGRVLAGDIWGMGAFVGEKTARAEQSGQPTVCDSHKRSHS